MPEKSLPNIRAPLIVAATAIGFMLALTPAAWSLSRSVSGGAAQPAQANSGSGNQGLTILPEDLLSSPDVTVTVDNPTADLASCDKDAANPSDPKRPSGVDNPTADLASCDKDAANPSDPKRPSGVAGVAFNKIDTKQAVNDCRAAVKSNPDDPRAMYELGRALEAGQQYDEAMRYYRKAADAGYATAMVSIGLLYENGNGVGQDLSAAKSWYQKAIDAGDTLAKSNLSDVEQTMQAKAPATPPQVAPSPPAETASDDKSDILSRLGGTWINMTDEGCLIGFNANIINYDYSDCRHVGWDYVGIKKWKSPSLVYLYARDGGVMEADVTFYGDRVSFRLWNCDGMYSWCYVGSFGFEKLN